MPDNDDAEKPAARRLSLVERAARQLEAAALGRPAILKAAPLPSRPRLGHEAEPAQLQDDLSDPGLADTTNMVFLDIEALGAKGLVTPRGERGRMSEEYRLIKRPLLQYAKAGLKNPALKSNLLMVTSPLPGDGKTFTSINLAMSMAKERDVKVLLIDADLSRPSIASRLDITEKTLGLTDLLDDESLDISDVLLRTNVPNFSIIPAGRSHKMGTELLASRRAEAVIAELGGRYPDRIIMFDTSPVLATSEGAALGLQVGQVILVVEAEKTTELDIRGALDVLSGCSNVMLLLNKTRTRFAFHRYGYYYGEYGSRG